MAQHETFAFIIHPIDPKRDIARKYPLLARMFNERQIDYLCQFWPPVYISEITGVTSQATGRQLTGWFIAAPYTPRAMLRVPVNTVYRKIVEAGHLAERLGAKIMGLGAFTSVVGDAGVTIAQRLEIPVTTGDAYTVATSVQGIREAARQMGVDLAHASAAVVGASGAIGSVCAQLLAEEVGRLILVGKRELATEAVREQCEGKHAKVEASTHLDDIKQADLILAATSATSAIIRAEHLKPGAVVCDVAVPRNVSPGLSKRRDDVLIIEGGMVEVPGPVDFHFNFGYPRGKAYGCMAETMALALEGRFEDYTLGRNIEIARVKEIEAIATRHGFKLSGLRSFEREVTAEHIARVRQRAEDTRRDLRPVGAVM